MWEILLENLPILICFVLGMGLLVVEVFMPGFGLPGIAGIILAIGGDFGAGRHCRVACPAIRQQGQAVQIAHDSQRL